MAIESRKYKTPASSTGGSGHTDAEGKGDGT